jgi:YfiH family protein
VAADPSSPSPCFRLERLDNGWLVGRFAALEQIGIAHLVTTRQGPDVNQVRHATAEAGDLISPILGLHSMAFLKQVHGNVALVCKGTGEVGQADGLCTDRPGLGLMGKSGDCPIILVADRGRRAVGFAHASWRATVAGIVPSLVGRMESLGCSAQGLVACICPSAGPECYEVGPEVRQEAIASMGPHAEAFFIPGPAKDHFDLWAANVDALCRVGLHCENIHVAGVCTLCSNDLFPSHRREGDAAGRFVGVIGLPLRGTEGVHCRE